MRTITLRAYNGDVHTIPYSSIDVVTNMTKDFSFYVFDLVVAYKEDVDRVIEVLREIDSQLRREWPYRRLMLEPLEIAGVDAFRDSGVLVKARTKVRAGEQWKVGREFNRRIKRRFDELGIELPVPQQKIVFSGHQGGGRRGDAAGADAPSRRRGLMRAGLGMRGAALVAALLLAGCGDDGGDARPVGRGRRRAAGEPATDPLRGRLRRRPAARAGRASCGRSSTAPAQGAAPPDQPPRHPPARRGRPGASWSRRCGRRAISTARWASRSSTSAEAPRPNGRDRGAAAGDPARGRAARSTSCPARATASARSRSTSPTTPTASTAPTPEDLGLVAGEPALTQAVLDAEQKLLADARKAGFAAGQARRARGRSSTTRRGRWTSRCGSTPAGGPSSARSASPAATASTRTSCARRVPIEAGQRYDPTLVTEGQNNLFDTNLFSTIVPRPAEILTDDQRLDLVYDLQAAPAALDRRRAQLRDRHRPGRSGCSGSTATSSAPASGSASRPPAAEPQQSLTASLLKPDFLRPNQNLLTDVVAAPRPARGLRRAIRSAPASSVEREISKQLKVSLGTAFRYARIEDLKEPEQSFALLSFPAKIDWDFANDRFSPTSGGTLVVTADPLRRPARHRPQLPQGSADHHPLPPAELCTAASSWPLRGVDRRAGRRQPRRRPGRRAVLCRRRRLDPRHRLRAGRPAGRRRQAAGRPLGDRGQRRAAHPVARTISALALFLDAGTVDTSVFPSLRGAGPVRRRPELALLHPGGADPLRHRLPLEPPQGCRLGLSALLQYRAVVLSGRGTERPAGTRK